MRKIGYISVVALAAVALASTAMAAYEGQVRIEQGNWQTGTGGEFRVVPLSGFAGLTGLPGDQNATTFQTFCIQTGEQIRFNGLYDYNKNVVTVAGNVPLSPQVAYLYTQFRYGTLDATAYGAANPYRFAGTNAERQADAGQLQQALWFLMGQGGANNAYVALANAVVGGGSWTGIGQVRILNLFNGPPNNPPAPWNNQDVLTLIPVPGAALLGVLGLGMAGWIKRRTV